MRRTPALVAAMAMTALAVTACGGGAPKPAPLPSHHLSAAMACKDFQDWLSAAQGNVANVGKSGILLAAIAVAPSGQLVSCLPAGRGVRSMGLLGEMGLPMALAVPWWGAAEDCVAVAGGPAAAAVVGCGAEGQGSSVSRGRRDEMGKTGAHAVVAGAGMGGLPAARVLPGEYERATIAGRDPLPESGPGRRVPQGRACPCAGAGWRADPRRPVPRPAR
jgi:hypothetical protein